MGRVLITIADEILDEISLEATKKDLKPATFIKLLAVERFNQIKEGKEVVHAKVEVNEVKKEVEEAAVIDDGEYGMQ